MEERSEPDTPAADTVCDATPSAALALAPGARVGRYTVLERVGAGAMGVVYSAYDPQLDRRIALKLLAAGSTVDRAGARLLREAKAMAQLSHPNVVAVHDLGTFEGGIYIAMELIVGQNLRGWLATPQPWREVVRVFVAAGRGLAAAHAIGLVHRDFKPDNVLIAEASPGARGRVCVADFGLATADGEADGNSSDAARIIGSTSLTRTGFVMGTPAYMAPELHSGARADALADQFAFCVALWEALHGVRPFAGDTRDELLGAMLRHRLRAGAHEHTVPSWLHRVLDRGLLVDSARRYPSMDALIAELERDRTRRRLRAVAAIAVGVGALAAVRIATLAQGRLERCNAGAEQIAAAWNDERRDAMRTAFVDSGRAYAAATWDRLEHDLQTHASAWANMYDEACAATVIRGEQSDRALDLRMGCLRRRRAELATVTETLAVGGDEVLARAADLVDGLAPLEHCADLERLDAAVELPTDPDARATVDRIGEQLARARALHGAARFADAEALTRVSLDAARAVEHAPTLAEALLGHALTTASLHGTSQSLDTLHEAIVTANAAGRDDVALEAWDQLMVVVAVHEHRSDEALHYLRAGDAALARLRGEDRPAAASHGYARACVLEQASRFADATAGYRSAKSEFVELHGEFDRRVIQAAASLARVLQETGDFVGAEREGREALALAEQRLGAEHPAVADAETQLGMLLHRRGDFAQARESFARALVIREKAHPADHAIVIASINNLATAELGLGHFDRAQLGFERVVAFEEARGNEFSLAQSVHNLGATELERGDLEAAEPTLRRALALFERVLAPDDPQLCNSLETIAALLTERGRLDEARALLERSQRLWERSGRTEHPGYGGVLAELGRIELRQGHPARAIPALQRALEVLEAHAVEPIMIGHTYMDLGQAQKQHGDDRGAARSIARARTIVADLEGHEAEQIRAGIATNTWPPAR